jgi:hypothetical protein
LPLSTEAQLNYNTGAETVFGGRAGATLSSVSFFPSVEATGWLPGVEAGVMFRYCGEKYLAFQMEANFMQRGWHEQDSGYIFSRQFNYLQLPLLTHLFIGKKSVRWFLNLGPNIGILLSESSTPVPNEPQAQHTEPVKSRFDYGIGAGTGIEIHTKRAGIYQLEGRYTIGLGNLFASTVANSFRRSANRNFSLTVAVLFPVKK